MKLQLPIIPSFLQQRLSFTRLLLLGSIELATVTDAGSQQISSHRVRKHATNSSLRFTSTLLQWLVVAVAVGLLSLWWGPLIWSKLKFETNLTVSAFASDSLAHASQLVAGWSGDSKEPVDSSANLVSIPVAGQSGQSEFVEVQQEPPTTQTFVDADVNDRYLPESNPDLPVGEWLVISKIGVRSQLQSTVDFEEALKTGLWRAPNFGKPGSTQLPMIVAGHRYGWKWWWKDDYWKYNSFNLLPELQVGDRVEVISDQRKWTYEIYSIGEGTEITDYQADLILYTCKYLQSPLRFFRYAKLVVE